MLHPRTLRQVGQFVADRLDDEVRRADEGADKPALAFTLGTVDLLTAMRRDVDERPWARREVGNYLFRSARLRRHHPAYRHDWDHS